MVKFAVDACGYLITVTPYVHTGFAMNWKVLVY